jgi:hypothetical protein
MHQPTASARSHCLSPARAKTAIDAPLGPTTYARMFPQLPQFQADEEFLYALGRTGGVCDCGDASWLTYWWDSSMPMRHRFVGATKNGDLKKHLASYWPPSGGYPGHTREKRVSRLCHRNGKVAEPRFTVGPPSRIASVSVKKPLSQSFQIRFALRQAHF